MLDLWSDIDRAVLECLAAGHAVPADIGAQLGMSEAAATAIRPEVRRRYPLAAAADAHRDLEARRTSGQIVLHA